MKIELAVLDGVCCASSVVCFPSVYFDSSDIRK